ncbi:MAG: YjjG family noncanonical pyrimidine nucleotidase [Prolixibacteraceae bacterium]|nr:YjjG family noncanonical pyrimidine nucleotidase [Prolixibacteraceae bacterium]
MRKYDHLFFDLDNTLWDFAANSRQAMQITIEQENILSRLESFDAYWKVYEEINHTLWNDYHNKQITKQHLISERFSRSLNKFQIFDLDWEELNRNYLANMALQTELFPKSIETLEILREKGYQMHIITNGFREVQRDKLRNCGLEKYISKVFISEEIHTTKPHRQIFEHALKSTNARKKKSIMIGDSWEIDIEGAMNFGIDQIMFLNQGAHLVPEPIKSMQLAANSSYLELKHQTRTWFINEITDLLKIL